MRSTREWSHPGCGFGISTALACFLALSLLLCYVYLIARLRLHVITSALLTLMLPCFLGAFCSKADFDEEDWNEEELAARRIQASARGRLDRARVAQMRAMREEEHAAVKIQAIARGRRDR